MPVAFVHGPFYLFQRNAGYSPLSPKSTSFAEQTRIQLLPASLLTPCLKLFRQTRQYQQGRMVNSITASKSRSSRRLIHKRSPHRLLSSLRIAMSQAPFCSPEYPSGCRTAQLSKRNIKCKQDQSCSGRSSAFIDIIFQCRPVIKYGIVIPARASKQYRLSRINSLRRRRQKLRRGRKNMPDRPR